MDIQKRKKRQSIKVIASEALMVATVIITVVILAFVVSGYWVNSDFEVERQGMLQISSSPTGANVSIDGDTSWLQRTNTSKVLASGEHEITLTKDNYDTWSKTVNIKEGLLYRLQYPRLFLKERQPEKILSLPQVAQATISPDRESLVLLGDTAEWSLIDLRADHPSIKALDMSGLFPATTSLDGSATIPNYQAELIRWSQDNTRILLKAKIGDSTDWLLANIDNVKESVNLTKEFNATFSDIEIIDNSANTLLAVQDGNLHKIDLNSHSISAVLVKDIKYFDHYENSIVFSAASTDQPVNENTDNSADNANNSSQNGTDTINDSDFYIGYLKLGDKNPTKLAAATTPTPVLIGKFYDETYISTLSGNTLSVHHKSDFSNFTEYQLTFAPVKSAMGHDGEFITMYNGAQIATLDMEAGAVREWQLESDAFDWLDSNMIYTVKDGELIVYDFDGYNRRSLASRVATTLPISITDNKWLYYFSDDGQLMREWIIEH